MPRDLPLGNGVLLINFDATYTIRDIFYPHVGIENHVIGYQCRLGFWADGKFAWTADDAWKRDLRYEDDTLVTSVRLEHPGLGLAVRIADAVDFALPMMARKFVIEPGPKDVRIFLGLDLRILGNPIGDTALYKPDIRAILHYKEDRYFLHGGIGANGAIDQWAVGQKAINNQEGTWRDAEDGELSGNSISQGSVDSVIALHASGDPSADRVVYAWLALGKNLDGVQNLHDRLLEMPQHYIDRTRNYWMLWANKQNTDFGPMPPQLIKQYKRSLLTIRTQVDEEGGILAANDSDIQAFAGDTYSYVWPRDGALVAFALDEAGRHELSNRFFQFCGRVINPNGYFQHKYNADGTLASSWHPYWFEGRPRLPIQEDETALVLWSLWHHFDRTRSIETIRDLYGPVVVTAAKFLVAYADPAGLCKASYDLWEERWGVHAFTVGAVYGGLTAAGNFARAFGELKDATLFTDAAEKLKVAVHKHFFDDRQFRFARMLNCDRQGNLTPDWTQDAAIFGLFAFGMFDPNYAPYTKAMDGLFERLWVKTDVGGVARYVNDYYFQTTNDVEKVAGNPWFICTLWRARYAIARARSREELERALPLMQWVAERALPSGILAEQVNPFTDQPLSVSPLTWSHAEFITTFLAYLDKLSTLGECPMCHRPLYLRERFEAHTHDTAQLGTPA